MRLPDEADLERAEQTLQIWATILAEDNCDTDAADALRIANQILKFRTSFQESAKS